ncbi:Ig-like domain-containing protein [Rubritalea tangerina]|uniref:Ig-like domain-containing protein n=1 Tax=Rubritalea tangerina TaxID=430798 RepID=A0ABW4ZF54_9BACT
MRARLREVVLLLGASVVGKAAPIEWGAAEAVVSKSQLLEGVVVLAIDGGNGVVVQNGGSSGSSSYTFTGMQYTGMALAESVTSNVFSGALNGGTSGDAQFDSLLNSFTHTTSGNTEVTQTLSGLTVGASYQLQIFFNDQRGSSSGRVMSYGDAEQVSNTVGLTAGTGELGHMAVGTFVADATTQVLRHATNGFGNVHVNALLLVELSSQPAVMLTSASSEVQGRFQVALEFSEDVTGLSESDFVVSNGGIEAGSLSGSGRQWSVDVEPTASGLVGVSLPEGVVVDTDGDNKGNAASDVLEVVYVAPGSDRPSAVLRTQNNQVNGVFTVVLEMSEAVCGLGVDDFEVGNGMVSSLQGSGSSYQMSIVPEDVGTVTVLVIENGVVDVDGDGLGNRASNLLEVENVAALEAAIYGGRRAESPEFRVYVSFSEAVDALGVGDVVVTNAEVLRVVTNAKADFAKRYYQIDLRAKKPGEVSIQIPAGAVGAQANGESRNKASNNFKVQCVADFAEKWLVDDQASWEAATGVGSHMTFVDGFVEPNADVASFSSTVRAYANKKKARHVTFRQSPVWDNWVASGNIGGGGSDAAILLPVADDDYYYLARGSSGGYHAWHSTDMVNWTHHGAVTKGPEHRWVTTAEYMDGKFYIYVDYPNDHTPGLYVDENLKDGQLGVFYEKAFDDPTHGSDCSVFRDDADGLFHLIHEDWTPINARSHSWDSPLAGHVSSPDGGQFTPFKPAMHQPAVDVRTTNTGEIGSYASASSHEETGEWIGPFEYEIHSPGQDAYGDWTTIKVGSQYYLFGDFDEHGSGIKVGRLTAGSIYEEFKYVGKLGSGHPDPTVGFAEGQFYLITQRSTDYISPGPWVEGVEARAGVDIDGDGVVDQWTAWQDVAEEYDHKAGYARVVECQPARVDMSGLAEGYGFQFEFRVDDTVVSGVKPIMDAVEMEFEPTEFQKWSNENDTPKDPLGDHNQNNVLNLIEFVTGRSERVDLVPNSDGRIAITVKGASLRDGYTLGLEYSEDLIAWYRVTGESALVRELGSSVQANEDVVHAFEVAQGAGQLFWRVRID